MHTCSNCRHWQRGFWHDKDGTCAAMRESKKETESCLLFTERGSNEPVKKIRERY